MRYFLIAVAVTYVIAFVSFAFQVEDLYGDKGLLPKAYPHAHSIQLKHRTKPRTATSLFRDSTKLDYHSWETMDITRITLNLGMFAGLSYTEWLQCLCAFGSTLCLLTIISLSKYVPANKASASSMLGSSPHWLVCSVVFLIVRFLYWLLVREIGDVFMSFQWDILLAEVGLLCSLIAAFEFVASLRTEATHNRAAEAEDDFFQLPRFLVKLLAFKLLFLSGVVKIQSECPTWLGLTALEYHYSTQPIPGPLAPYAHALSPFIQSLSVAATLVLQVIVSFFFLLPFSWSGVAWGHAVLQALIILTGNYNFFNVLTIVLVMQARGRGRLATLTNLVTLVVTLSFLTNYFRWPDRAAFERQGDLLSIMFSFPRRLIPTLSVAQFDRFVAAIGVPLAYCLTALSVSLLVVLDISKLLSNISGRHIVRLFVQSLLFVCLLAISFSVICGNLNHVASMDRLHRRPSKLDSIPYGNELYESGQFVKQLAAQYPNNVMEALQVKRLAPELAQTWQYLHEEAKYSTFSYGLFRRMTGVGNEPGEPVKVARPEVILEVSMDGQHWDEVEFYFKPGNLSRSLPINVPHQPRLDWQMWFAALQPNPPHWLVHLAYRLLRGQYLSTNLMPPLPTPYTAKRPPQYVRAFLYDYDLVRPPTVPEAAAQHSRKKKKSKRQSSSPNGSEEEQGTVWRRWNRREYLPPIEVDNQSLQQFMKKLNWDGPQQRQQVKLTAAIKELQDPTGILSLELIRAYALSAAGIGWLALFGFAKTLSFVLKFVF